MGIPVLVRQYLCIEMASRSIRHLYDLSGICWNIYDSSSQDLAFSVPFYATFLLPNESLFSIFNKWHYQIPPDFYAASLPWSDLINVLCSRDPWTLGGRQAWSITVTILGRHNHVMTSSNENIFRVTGPLCREFTGTHKGQWRGALMFSLICAWTNGWVNTWDTGDLRRHSTHYDITLMSAFFLFIRDLFNGLVQERHNSSALTMELHLSCTNSSILCMCATNERQC